MSRRSDHSREELTALILQAAGDIVEQQGVQALSARKVAREIGYTVGTLYHVFKNFDDLIIHVNTVTLTELASDIRNELRNKRSPRSIIKAMANTYVQFATRHPDRWRLIFEHQASDKAPEPTKLIEQRDDMFRLVADVVHQLAPQLSTQAIAHHATALWSGIHGICMLAITNKLYLGGASNINKLIETLIDAVIDSLVARN